jgi:amidase
MDARRKTFESLGSIVEEAEPNFEGADEAFRTLRALGFHQQHAAKVAQYRDQIKATVLEEVDLGAKLTSAQINEADALRSALYERVGEFFGKYEFLCSAQTQVPAFDINQPYVAEIEGRKMGNYIDWMRSCYYISVLHNPRSRCRADSRRKGCQWVSKLWAGITMIGACCRWPTPLSRRRKCERFRRWQGSLPLDIKERL